MFPRQTKRTETGCGETVSPIAVSVYEPCIRVFGVYVVQGKKKLPIAVEKQNEDLGMVGRIGCQDDVRD